MDVQKATERVCFHCGKKCNDGCLTHKSKSFCCNGCKTVYAILQDNDLMYYYDLEQYPGVTPSSYVDKFNFLDETSIKSKLLDFDEQDIQIVTLVIPSVHCSSCIWILEHLSKLSPYIRSSKINFHEKKLQVIYDAIHMNLKELVVLLCTIGYEPYISLQDLSKKKKKV